MNNETRKSDGTVTAYGFACGYVQRHGELTLRKAIKDYWIMYPQEIGDHYEWEHYQYLTDARRRFNKLMRERSI